MASYKAGLVRPAHFSSFGSFESFESCLEAQSEQQALAEPCLHCVSPFNVYRCLPSVPMSPPWHLLGTSRKVLSCFIQAAEARFIELLQAERFSHRQILA